MLSPIRRKPSYGRPWQEFGRIDHQVAVRSWIICLSYLINRGAGAALMRRLTLASVSAPATVVCVTT